MSISGVGQNYYQNHEISAKNVNNTEKSALEKTGNAQELSEAEEMELFKKEFYAELESIPKNGTIVNLAVNISEEAFKNMKANPEYRAKIMSVLRRDLTSSFSPLKASLLITVGASEEDYRGDSWSGPNNDSEFFARSQNSFYKKTSGRKDREKELLEEYLKRRAQAKKQQQEFLDEKSIKEEQERNRLTKEEQERSRFEKAWGVKAASNAYEANVIKCLKSQKNQNGDRKVFHRDSLEVSQLSKNRAILMDKIKRTVVRPAVLLSDTRAGILKEVREEKGQYDYSDVVNACGLSYAKLYSEIEQRHAKEQYNKPDGTLLTMEEEIEWLDMQYEQEIAWQKSCARIAAQGQVFQGNIPEMPAKEIEELEDSFYQAKDAYMKLYHESRQAGKPLTRQNNIFGNNQMYEMLNKLSNLPGCRHDSI